ncbi:MAG: DUF3108 domain-containing protein [Marinilabiliales bacterium]|nr:MAG: DUF3108 domain-containing protein [Marinilabiliales bacterium]
MKRLIYLLSLVFLFSSVQGQKEIVNTAFQQGEEIAYVIAYKWGIVDTDVGKVLFKVNRDTIDNKDLFHLDAIGTTFPAWDWFFKVRDRYQSWIDPVTLAPYRFYRHVNEGGWKLNLKYNFHHDQNMVYSRFKINDEPLQYDTIKIEGHETFDLLSVVYLSRCIDFNSFKEGDKIPITLMVDAKVENLYFRYLGKEKVKVRRHESYNCIKFGVQVLEGSVFPEGGENLIVWASDDKNKIPIMIKSPIIVGSVLVRIVSSSGLKHAVTSRIE